MKKITTYYLIMYDITNNKVLKKIANKLIKYGFERINYSVWLGWTNPFQCGTFKNELQELLHNVKCEGSRLYIIPLKPNTIDKMRSISGHKPNELDFWLGKAKYRFF